MTTPGQDQLAAEASRRIGNSLKRVESLLERVKSRALRSFDLTLPQYVTLMALHYVPGQSAAHLARTALVSTQTMATILGNLERKGLVSRDSTDLHARVLVNTLTDEGSELAQRADVVVRGIEDGLREVYEPAEVDAFIAFLGRAEEHLLEADPDR